MGDDESLRMNAGFQDNSSERASIVEYKNRGHDLPSSTRTASSSDTPL